MRWIGRMWALVAIAVLSAAAALAAHGAGLLDRVERTTVDARFSLRGAQRPPRGIVIVAIDDGSLAQLPRFPFKRSLYAPVIDRLHAAGARVIAFDIEFTRPTTAAADDALIDAAGRARPVVFATTGIDRHGGTAVLGGPLVRREVGAQAGATAALPDSSGVIRRVPYSVRGLPSFAVVIAADRTGRPVDRAAFADGGAVIDYLGPARTFTTVPFVDVLRGRVAPSLFRDSEVIVGETAPSGQDLHPSPLGVLSGAEVQANALATILAGFPLRNAPGWLTSALIVALAMVAPLASVARRALVTVAAAVAALGLLAIGAQLAFDAGRILDFTDSLMALGLASVATVTVDYVLQDRERRRLRELFAAASPDVVTQVLAPGGAGALPATRVIGGYRMEEVIGRGAMGVVYKGTQLSLARPVAVKVISPDHAASRVYRERFKRESRLAATVEHANVIPVYEAGEDHGLLFIAMRYVDGLDLGVLVERLGPLPPGRAAAIVVEVAGALDAAHERGLTHRDVKPANILLTVDQPEHAYLTDFGVAKLSSAEDTVMTNPGQWVGTVDYIAPEQLRGETRGGSGDIYALGGVLHYALTGSVPYPVEGELATILAHLNDPSPVPSAHEPALAAFDPVVARAMAKEPSDRFASATALGAAAARAARAAGAV